MRDAVISIVLAIPAAAQVLGCLSLALAGDKLGFAIQSRQRSAGPVEFAIGLMLAATHIGYVLAPFWWGTGRRWWAVLLMIPIAFIVLGGIAFAFREPLSGDGTSSQVRTALVAIGLAAAVYLGPIIATAVLRR